MLSRKQIFLAQIRTEKRSQAFPFRLVHHEFWRSADPMTPEPIKLVVQQDERKKAVAT
jgi:hypothetical protein